MCRSILYHVASHRSFPSKAVSPLRKELMIERLRVDCSRRKRGQSLLSTLRPLGLAVSKGQLHRRKCEQRWTRRDLTHWSRLASSARQLRTAKTCRAKSILQFAITRMHVGREPLLIDDFSPERSQQFALFARERRT